jgi:quercetin dioxygenase-like cupin family protein
MSDSSVKNSVLEANNALVQEFDWGRLIWFVSGQIGNSATMTLGKCILKPGHHNPRHHHPNCEEVLQVIQGRIVHSLNDAEFEMGAGDTIVIPPNIIHNARNIGSEDAILTIVFSSSERQTVGEF